MFTVSTQKLSGWRAVSFPNGSSLSLSLLFEYFWFIFCRRNRSVMHGSRVVWRLKRKSFSRTPWWPASHFWNHVEDVYRCFRCLLPLKLFFGLLLCEVQLIVSSLTVGSLSVCLTTWLVPVCCNTRRCDVSYNQILRNKDFITKTGQICPESFLNFRGRGELKYKSGDYSFIFLIVSKSHERLKTNTECVSVCDSLISSSSEILYCPKTVFLY